MKTLDTYLNLCTQVYDLSKPAPPIESYNFYRDYALEAHGPILEPMCGTGRFLLPFIEEGLNVHGFDASDFMLEALHSKAQAKNLQPRVWKNFVNELNRQEQYALIFIPCGSFGLIIDTEEVKKALKLFYNHLTPNGILLFEAETSKAVPPLNRWRGSLWSKSDGKMILCNQLATLKDNICHSVGKYELVDSHHIIQTEVEVLKVRIYDDSQELTNMLKEVGFKNIRIIKAFDRTKNPDGNDEAVVYECQK